MSKKLLTKLPLIYADSVIFENTVNNFRLTIINREHRLTVLLSNILVFNFSKSSLAPNEGWIDIIAINHEYRKPMPKDFRKYSFYVDKIDEYPLLHIITFHGDSVIEVVCENIEIDEESQFDSATQFG